MTNIYESITFEGVVYKIKSVEYEHNNNFISRNMRGDVVFYKDNTVIPHNDHDQPAIIKADGEIQYYKNGRLHRDGDLPAVICANGDIEYYLNGKRHRENGPAVIRKNGDKIWYFEGKIHRGYEDESGSGSEGKNNEPAIELTNGGRIWFKHGVFIRGELACAENPCQ